MTVPDGERRNIMENSENKKTPEELADEALDKVAGGEWVGVPFVNNNCKSCRHYKKNRNLNVPTDLRRMPWLSCKAGLYGALRHSAQARRLDR